MIKDDQKVQSLRTFPYSSRVPQYKTKLISDGSDTRLCRLATTLDTRRVNTRRVSENLSNTFANVSSTSVCAAYRLHHSRRTLAHPKLVLNIRKFEISNLFRISCSGFRIFWCTVCITLHLKKYKTNPIGGNSHYKKISYI